MFGNAVFVKHTATFTKLATGTVLCRSNRDVHKMYNANNWTTQVCLVNILYFHVDALFNKLVHLNSPGVWSTPIFCQTHRQCCT